MALIQCPECQGQVSRFAATCPHCGHGLSPAVVREPRQATKGASSWGSVGKLVVVGLLLFGATRLFGEAPADGRKVDLRVSGADWHYEGGAMWIVGTVKNQSGRNYSFVQVEINLYDRSGVLLESTLDNVSNLAAGGSWRFKAPVLKRGADRFSVVRVQGT